METLASELQKQINSLLNDNTELNLKLSQLEQNEQNLKSENNNLRKENRKIKNEIEKLTNKNIKLKDDKNELEKENRKLKSENKKLENENFRLNQLLNISSRTASLPPSQDAEWVEDTNVYSERSQKTTTKPVGGQEGHKKNSLPKFKDEEVTEHKEHKLGNCPCCGGDNLVLLGEETRDEKDYEMLLKNIRHHGYKYKCSSCGKIVKSDILKTLHGENQYGANTQALALSLLDYGDVSYKRTKELIKGITNDEISLSEGYIAKLPKRASNSLKEFILDAENKIINSAIVQHDDGIIKIGKKEEDKKEELNSLIEKSKKDLTEDDINKMGDEIKKNFKGVFRAYTNGDVKLYKAHTNKSADTYEEDNILNRLSSNTIVVHDHMKYNYNKKFNFQNAECNIHAIRKCRGVDANTQHEWPDLIINLLESYHHKRKGLKEKGICHFESADLENLNSSYDRIIENGLIECDQFSHKDIYKVESNLLNFFKNYKDEVLRWSINFSIPFTNNLCETMIRLVKSKMKISYFFKNIESAQYYANLITYTETCSNFGISRYKAIGRLFNNNPYSISELYKLKETQVA